MITNNNFASTAINEDKIYCGKGTALISKKNVKTNKGKDIFNNEKMLLSMTKIRIDDGKETKLIIAAIHTMNGLGPRK